MKYKLKVNEQYEFALSGEDATALDSQKTGEDTEHILYRNHSYHIEYEHADFNGKYYEILVNGNVYKVQITDELDALISSMGLNAVTTKKNSQIPSPMPGLILEVRVAPGDDVNEGDVLLILEAMKMENTIMATSQGKVKEVHVSPGDSVEKGQILLELE